MLSEPLSLSLLTLLSVIGVYFRIVKMKISFGIHIKIQVNGCVPQENSVTQRLKPPIAVSSLAPVIGLLLIKARQRYIALKHNVLTRCAERHSEIGNTVIIYLTSENCAFCVKDTSCILNSTYLDRISVGFSFVKSVQIFGILQIFLALKHIGTSWTP